MNRIRLEDLEVFARVVDWMSFSGAARALGISPVVASNSIKRLEQSLGVRLFVRTTRSLQLSDEGARYLSYARDALRVVQEGQGAVAAFKSDFNGRLSVSLPSDIGRNHLLAWIEQHLDSYDPLELHVAVGDTLANPHEKPIDLTIRYGLPGDGGRVYVPLCAQNTCVLCASPVYLANHDGITKLADLSQHNCLRSEINEVVYSRWSFGEHDSPSVLVHGDRVAKDSELVRQWAIAGLGVAYISELDAAEDLRSGRLQRVLPNVRGELAPLGMVAAHRKLLTPGVANLANALRIRCTRHLDGLSTNT